MINLLHRAPNLRRGSHIGLYFENLRPMMFVTLPIQLLALLGMSGLVAKSDHLNLAFMLSIFPAWAWCGMLGVAVALRFAELFLWRGTIETRILTPTIGLWFWSFVFISTVMLTSLYILSIACLLPILIEFWILSRVIGETL